MERIMKYWDVARVIVIFGGNRAGKTDILCRIALKIAAEKPEADVSYWQENDKPEVSVKIGQQKIFDLLPSIYKGHEIKALKKKKGDNYSIDFKQQSGFSNNACILPPMHKLQKNGSSITFKSYSSFANSPQVSEGYNSDAEIYDEEPPFELFKRGSRPITDRGGKRIWGCTLVKGYGELAGFVLDGAETLESQYFEYAGKEIPLVQKSKRVDGCYIFYLPTEENPFIDFEDVKANLSGLSDEERLVRAYGVPTKRTGGLFPLFSENIHVVKDSEIPKEGITRYMMLDPAGKKPFAAIWYAVDKKNRVWIYREWPDRKSFGPWCEPGGDGLRSKGKKGPAMKIPGLGCEGYVALFKKLEGEEAIAMRYMDPRGNKTRQGEMGEVTQQNDLEKAGMYFFMAGGENDIDPGIQRINDFLSYNPDEAISAANQPKLYIAESCGNTIYSMKNHTGEGGYEEYTKDFVDLVRYAVSSNPMFFDAKMGVRKNGYGRYY
jgi:hypothetical protein